MEDGQYERRTTMDSSKGTRTREERGERTARTARTARVRDVQREILRGI